MKIYVGNLSFDTTESQLAEAFSTHGNVRSTTIVTDRDTGRTRGFGFIEMNDDDARKAIEAMNGVELSGRQLTVNEAKPRADGPRTGGFGGRSGGGGGGGGRGFGGGGGRRY